MAASQVQLQSITFHNLWSAPMRIVLGTVLLYDALGPAVLIGVGLLIVITPIQIRVMQRLAKLMKINFGISDRRIKLMNEVLPGKVVAAPVA